MACMKRLTRVPALGYEFLSATVTNAEVSSSAVTGVKDVSGEVEKLTGTKRMRFAFACDLDAALDALDCYLAGYLVRWKCLSFSENQTHNFQVGGLEECSCLRRRDPASKRLDVYDLARNSMFECHGNEYAPLGLVRRLTFELSGPHRVGAWAARRMMTLAGLAGPSGKPVEVRSSEGLGRILARADALAGVVTTIGCSWTKPGGRHEQSCGATFSALRATYAKRLHTCR